MGIYQNMCDEFLLTTTIVIWLFRFLGYIILYDFHSSNVNCVITMGRPIFCDGWKFDGG